MTKKTRPFAMTFTQKSRVQQHQKDETDINKIMARYVKTGVIDHINTHQPHYGDNTALDYQQSLNIILHAENMFAELPAQARKHFDNNPETFLKFVEDPSNHDKLYDLGLSNSPMKPETTPDPLVKPAEPKAATSEPAAAAPEPTA